MPVTRALVVSKVVNRVGGLLARAGLPTTPDETNDALLDPAQKALVLWLGVATADPSALTDADLAGVTGARAEKLFDAATLEALNLILGRLALVDERVGERDQKNSQLADQVAKLAARYEARLGKPAGALSAPCVRASTAGVPMPNDPLRPWQTRAPWCSWPYPDGNP